MMEARDEEKNESGYCPSSSDPDQTSVMKPVSPSHTDMMRLMAATPAPSETNADARKNRKCK